MAEEKKVWSQEIEDQVDSLCLFDDDFLSLVLDKNYEATEYVLNTILNRNDLKVTNVVVQKDYFNHMAGGRNIVIDIYAEDSTGKVYDIEVQRADSGAKPQRARFHSAMIDTRLLKEKQKFTEIKDSYVIFITQNDVLKGGLPIYHIDRTIKELKNKSFDDGNHIIYVNGAYKDDTSEIGRMVHDFGCVRASDMYNNILKKQVSYFKETEGGRDIMCEMIENYGDKRADRAILEKIKVVMKKLNETAEKAMEFLDIPQQDWEKYKAML